MADPANDPPQADADSLALALRGFGGKLRRRLREQAASAELTPAQTDVLLRLEQSPATTSALARAEAMRPQSMGAIVAALEAAGLVAGTPDPADGRQTILSLTDKCRNWLGQARAIRQDWLAHRIEALLSPEEQDRLAATLPLLSRLVGD